MLLTVRQSGDQPEGLDAANGALDVLEDLEQFVRGQRRMQARHQVDERRLVLHVLRRRAVQPRRGLHAARELAQQRQRALDVAELVACLAARRQPQEPRGGGPKTPQST
jgi:hypothetical protein